MSEMRGPKQDFAGVVGEVTAIVDWLAFTVPALDPVTVEEWLGEDWTETERGGMGYKKGKVCGHMRLYYDGQAGMGVHVEISGKGCREVEALWHFYDWATIIEGVTDRGGHVTRIDVAFDDRAGILSALEITRAIDEGRVVSRFKDALNMRKRRLVDGEGNGWTEQFGSAQSSVQVTMYDKAKEQGVEGHWLRVEMQFRHDRAEAAAEMVKAGKIAEIAGVLRGYIEFKTLPAGSDSNKRRWPAASWWVSFLDGCAKTRLQVKPRTRSLDDVYAWLDRSVGPSLAVFVEIADGELTTLATLAARNKSRLSARHEEMIKAYREGVPRIAASRR